MADTIERTIYKLELDDSGYIRGVESLSASTKRFADQQEAANKRLLENEKVLKTSADVVEKNRKALESYTGSDKKYKDQLEVNLKASQTGHEKLIELVANVRKGYESAKKAAEDFANTAQRATDVQQGTTGGKIPTGPPPGIVLPQIIQPAAFNDFNLRDLTENVTEEFDQLRVAIQIADERLDELNQTSEEFKLLAPIIRDAKKALQDFEAVQKQAVGSQLSLRTQLTQGKNELVKLEQAGKAASKQYQDLEIKVASLTDAYGDQQARIRVLSSDTRLLDFGKANVQSAISSFQAYSAVMILVGGENAKLQKRTMELFAAMQLLTALEQLSTQIKRGGVIATNLQSAAQATYTAVVGASVGALRAFKLALLGTGIGAAAVVIGLLVKKFIDMRDAAKEAAAEGKRLNDVIGEAKEDYTRAVVEVNNLKNAIQLAKDGFIKKTEVVTLYNETIGKTAGQVKTLDEAEQALNKNAEAYIQFTLLKAAANIALGKAAEEAFKIQEKFATATIADVGQVRGREIKFQAMLLADQAAASAKEAGKSQADIQLAYQAAYDNALKGGLSKTETTQKESFEKIAKDLQQQAAELSKQFGFNFFDPKGTAGGAKEIENVYIKNLRELLVRLRAASKTEIQSVDLIQQEFTNKLFDEIDKIDDLVKKKQLTVKQGDFLIKILEKIIGKESDKAVTDFKNKVQAAIDKLTKELADVQSKTNLDSLNLLQDEFDRRAKLIEFNEQKELEASKEATRERLSALDRSGLLANEKAYQDAKAVIITNGEQEALNIIQKFSQGRQDLAADLFSKSLDLTSQVFEEQILQLDEITAGKIQEEKLLFEAGTVNYDEFQKRITKILKDQKEARDKLRLQELNSELKAINERLKTVVSPEEKEGLQKRQRAVRSQIVDIQSQTNVVDPNTKQVETVQDYVEAVAALTDSVIAFWQKANEAESAALDKSIALQEKRVDAAQRIAERGNAQYLKQEEDRLKELQIKKENAARRELAINAALQASQLLVGITGAIAKISTPGIGIAETIGAISVIFAALATGYGLVRSLQGSQPKLAEGTTYVARGKNKSGTDTIPAWLNEGEAVIPERKNRNYKKSVEAIYHGKVPADVLNTFVENYVINKTTKNKDSFVNNYTKNADERKTLNTVEDVLKVVNNRLSNKSDTSEVKKYSEVTDKVFAENKSSVESKNVADLVSKVFNQVSDRKISTNELTLFINTYSKHLDEYDRINTIDDVYRVVNEISDKKITINKTKDFVNKESFINTYTKNKDEREALSVVKDVFDIVNNRLSKTIVQSDLKTSVESDFKSDIKTYSDLKNYSDVTDRVFSENKSLVESKNIIGLVRRIVNEVSDKKVNIKELTSFVRAYKKHTEDKKVIETAMKIATENKTVYDTTNERISTYKKFVDNVSKVDSSVLNRFINNYEGKKYFKGTPDLKGKPGVDMIPIWASRGEAIIPTDKNKAYSPTVKAVFEGTIPPEQINNFVNNYHKIKQVPAPNYERIKEAAEQHTGHDGKMASLLSEQNKKIDENNDLQRQTIRALKSMGVNVNMDRNGIALSVMEVVEQIKIDRRS